MKNIMKAFSAAAIALALNSCGSTYGAYGTNYPAYPNQYPNNTTVIVYRTPDGGSYRTGEIYRDRRGNVYQEGRVIRTVNIYENPGVIERYKVDQRRNRRHYNDYNNGNYNNGNYNNGYNR